MRLYDTARRAVVAFDPGPEVRLYTCGITPYDATHLGHAATYLVYDVLVRRLRDRGHRTRCVRNVTDVDDDILAKAAAEGIGHEELARATVERFDADMAWLGTLAPEVEPWASSAMGEIVAMTADLVDGGHAYEARGGVYFSVVTAEGFGTLSGLDRPAMVALAAERGGNPRDPAKRDPLDFVLWQPSAPGEPAWPSPWGPGRPGWHIECSVLAMRELGPTIDLHGGGSDLVFPHHECEVAQSEAATGRRPFVSHWLHTAMVRYEGEKMSKSLGNLVRVDELARSWEAMEVRLALLAHHYRTDWDWDEALLAGARARLTRWRAAGEGSGGLEAVRAALDDDLDTPTALVVLDEAAAAGGGVSEGAALLGVGLDPSGGPLA